MTQYNKAIAAVGGAVISIAALWGLDVSTQVQALIPIATAVVVFLIENR